MSAVEIQRALHVQLAYHVLAHLDLGDDAASLHDPALPRRPWVAPLAGAYRAAEGRLALQGLPLAVDDLEQLRAALAEPARSLGPGGSNVALAARFGESLEAELSSVRATFDPRRRAGLLAGRDRWLRHRLPPLRAALHASLGDGAAGEISTLRLVDCPALRCGRWTHGRALASAKGAVVVAAALDVPAEHALCQILHEEIHAYTDPAATPPATSGDAARDTQREAAGFELHRRLEQSAVDAGQRLLEDHAPGLLPTYRRWRARYGC